MDNNLAPKTNSCHVLSFGVNDDYSFDEEMNSIFNCQVDSFDPFIESIYFQSIRTQKPYLNSSPVLSIKPNWKFYRIGLSEKPSLIQNRVSADDQSFKIGDMFDFKSILKLIGAYEKTIDVLKIDIEGEEKSVLLNMDMDYVCKYVKQLMFETHKNFKFDELVRLEKCFYMFYRHTRFFLYDIGSPSGWRSEFQNGYQLNLSIFSNEVNMSEYMFVNGELYFANYNFF